MLPAASAAPAPTIPQLAARIFDCADAAAAHHRRAKGIGEGFREGFAEGYR